MAVEVKMPQLGESVHEGTIGKWLRAEGDTVEKYDPLLEVITDKVDTEITASHSGTLLKIVVPEGKTVQVGTVLAFIGEAGEVLDGAGGPATATTATTATAATSVTIDAIDATIDRSGPAPSIPPGFEGAEQGAFLSAEKSDKVADRVVPVRSDDAGTPRVSPVAARVAAEHDVDPSAVVGTGRGGQVKRQDVERHVTATGQPRNAEPDAPDIGFISPRVARLAAQNGIDLRLVRGSGRDGRITARDVEAFAATASIAPSVPATSSGAAAQVAPAVASDAPAQPASAGSAAPLTPAGPALPTVPAAPPAPPAPPAQAMPTAPDRPAPPATSTGRSAELVDEILALTPMRRAIADHMVNSMRTSPHVTTVHEVDMTTAMSAYRAERDAFAERGVRLTITAIVIDAVARAIAQHPLTNSSWTDAGIKLHREINIGMAVAIPDGLIVPVIRNADEKSLVGIARDVRDLAERARDKKLVVDDVQGGTFTITNYGTLGSLFGTPVINQPQCAILGIGSIKKRVVVMESDAGDTIAIRPMMYLALTFDHRILDGASADPFMQSVIENLEHYEIR